VKVAPAKRNFDDFDVRLCKIHHLAQPDIDTINKLYVEQLVKILTNQQKESDERLTSFGRGSFGHGIGHHQPQRPVPRGFPLFKHCEWLVFNRFVSKRRHPLRSRRMCKHCRLRASACDYQSWIRNNYDN